jgi:hypothetical protein
VPAHNYVDEERAQLEIEKIFRRLPLMLAMSCEISKPGDYRALDAAGVPVLIARGSDGAVLRTLGCFEQDTGTSHFAGRVRPTMQQVCKLLALTVIQCNKIFFLGHRWSSSCE